MGIEPTAPGVSPEPDGFEGRAGHQTRIASERGSKDNTHRAIEQLAGFGLVLSKIYSQTVRKADVEASNGPPSAPPRRTLWRGFDELVVE